MRLIVVFLVAIAMSGCLHGCTVAPMTNEQLFGGASKAPTLKVKRTWKGFEAEAGSNVDGSLKLDYSPETGQVHVDAQLKSNASGVLEQYPAWMGAMLPAQQAMFENNLAVNKEVTERHRIVGQNVKAVGEMLAMAAAAGGDAFSRMLDATAPILQGSGISLEGLGSLNLGTPTPPNP